MKRKYPFCGMSVLVVALAAVAMTQPGENKPLNKEPRIIELKQMTIAGIATFAPPGSERFPELWKSFHHAVEVSPGLETENYVYGLELYPPSFPEKPEFTYVAGCEVTDIQKVAPHLLTRTVPATQYAAFPVPGGLNGLLGTYTFIHEWLPKSNFERNGPFEIERYDLKTLPPAAGEMVIEVLVPVQLKKR